MKMVETSTSKTGFGADCVDVIKYYDITSSSSETRLFSIGITIRAIGNMSVHFRVDDKVKHIINSVSNSINNIEYLYSPKNSAYGSSWRGVACGASVSLDVDSSIDITTLLRDIVTMAVDAETYHDYFLIEKDKEEKEKARRIKELEGKVADRVSKLDNIIDIINSLT